MGPPPTTHSYMHKSILRLEKCVPEPLTLSKLGIKLQLREAKLGKGEVKHNNLRIWLLQTHD